MHSQDHNEPAISPRKQRFHLDIDPLQIGVYTRYDFEMDIFDILTTRSCARLIVGGNVMKEGNDFHDYRGVGGSVREAAQEAEKFWSQFPAGGVSVEVRTEVILKPAFRDLKTEPFYNDTYRAFGVSEIWRVDNDGGRLRPLIREIVTWKDGAYTPDHEDLLLVIEKANAEDISKAWRKKAS